MTEQFQTRHLRTTFKQRWQAAIRKKLWQMDIHPSAWIAPTALIDRTFPRGVHIGADCVIDHHAVILTHDMTRGLYLDTHVGAGTTVGPRAIVLPGISIGSDCIIEAGAVVVRDVPDRSRMAGNPAKRIEAGA